VLVGHPYWPLLARPPLLAAGTATVVLTGVAVANVYAWRWRPRQPGPPESRTPESSTPESRTS
jgi:hypothetical protein